MLDVRLEKQMWEGAIKHNYDQAMKLLRTREKQNWNLARELHKKNQKEDLKSRFLKKKEGRVRLSKEDVEEKQEYEWEKKDVQEIRSRGVYCKICRWREVKGDHQCPQKK